MNLFELEDRLKDMKPSERDVIIRGFKETNIKLEKAEVERDGYLIATNHLKWEKQVLLSRIEYLEGQLQYEKGGGEDVR